MTPDAVACQSDLPRVSVIVPLFNDLPRTRKCLASLSAQSWPAERTQIIVVDNGSSVDPTKTIADSFPHVIVVREEVVGSYAARNRGLAEADGQIIAFTDSDCIPERDWLASGVAVIEAEGESCGLVAGRVDMFFLNPDQPTGAELSDWTNGFDQQRYVEVFGFGVTANIFTRREVFDRVGVFNPALRSGGDREWCHRVVEAGYRLAYRDEVVVRHPVRRGLREVVGKRMRVVGGGIRRMTVDGASTWTMLGTILRTAFPPIRGLTRGYRQIRPLTPGRAIRYTTVQLLYQYCSAYEMLRVWFGGTPRR